MPNDIISLTEFKNDASGWVKRLQSQPPVVLTQNGRGVLVVQSYDAYRQQIDELAMMQIIARGEADVRAGRTIPHEQAMAEAYARIDAIAKAKAKSKSKPAPKAKAKAKQAAKKRA